MQPSEKSSQGPSRIWRKRAKTDRLSPRAGAQLLLGDLRRRAQAGPQDGDDPTRRQVGEVPQEPARARHDRLSVLTARTDLRGGDRPGRGDAARRPVAARHQARQPRVPSPRGADQLPRADLRPPGLRTRHRHSRALLADPRQPVGDDRGDEGVWRGAELVRPSARWRRWPRLAIRDSTAKPVDKPPSSLYIEANRWHSPRRVPEAPQ